MNFYNQLKYATPIDTRPRVASIRYASPGWIELSLVLEQAKLLAAIVVAVTGSIAACNATYHKIMTDLQRRKLLRIDVEKKEITLTRDELKLIGEYNRQLAKMLQIGSASAIDARTEKPLISLKILLSVYRRIRTLADYELKGKAQLPTATPKPDSPPKSRLR